MHEKFIENLRNPNNITSSQKAINYCPMKNHNFLSENLLMF